MAESTTATTTTTSKPSDNSDVQVVPSRISVIPFAVSLPTSTLQGFDEPAPKGDPIALVGDNGVVGTILVLDNAVQVWVGWGKIRLGSNPLQPKGVVTPSGAPPMGQLLVAMPPRTYKGAFASSGKNDASCSQLIGSASSDDQMLASQMASRLSTRTKKAVLMSCQLSQGDEDFLAGMDKEVLSHKAAALAEKEIWRILQQQQQDIESS